MVWSKFTSRLWSRQGVSWRRIYRDCKRGVCCALIASSAQAHQFTPTYPQLLPSYMPGILQTRMELFNSRREIEYYQLDVYDADWLPVPFATAERIVKIPHLSRKRIDIYIREIDSTRVMYICSMSKILRGVKGTVISSKICSKVK